MTDNMKKFLELVSGNEALATKFNSASRDEIIAFAKEQGIELTEADFEAANRELSEDELDAVAGGKECYCVIGGGGTGEDSNGTRTCACVAGGVGHMAGSEIKSRCGCIGGGYGGNTPI